MVRRIVIYLSEMFPLTAIVGTVLTALAVQLTYLRLHGVEPRWTAGLLLPGLFLTAINLLLRIMDEFKDYQDDLRNFVGSPGTELEFAL